MTLTLILLRFFEIVKFIKSLKMDVALCRSLSISIMISLKRTHPLDYSDVLFIKIGTVVPEIFSIEG
jgi:hypothetical protein